MGIQNLTSCDGWYYVAKGPAVGDIVFKVAAWALTERGEVIGLISASGAETDDKVSRLVFPPSIGGKYLPEEALSDSQRACAKKG
ncbi:MAG: hypothetical protein OEL53_11500 [Rhodospirillales bacterium]|nr:hypothetical protein [Rhodospirillales bacterium]